MFLYFPVQYTFTSIRWMADEEDVVSWDWDPGLPCVSHGDLDTS